MEPHTKRWTAILASLLLVAAPALAQNQSTGDDGDQDATYSNNSTNDGSDYNDTDGNETRDGSQDNETRDGSDQQRDGNASEADDRGEPDGNASEVADRARDLARDAKQNAKRNVSVVVDGAHALVDMSAEDDPSKDKISLDVAADQGRTKMAFDRDADDGEAPDLELDVQLADLVEYEDVDGDGAYDPGEDRVVQETQVQDLDWSVEAQEVAIDANATGQEIRAAAPVGENGSVAVVMTVPGDFATLGETELSPRDVKVDYVIDGYDFANESTKIALGIQVASDQDAEVGHADVGDMPAIQVAKGDATGYYSWKEHATVDGERTDVNVSLPDEADQNATEAVQKVYMSYGQGEEIVHDPVMGVSYETASEEVSGAPGFGTAALVVGIVSAAAVAGAVSRRD